mgnify:CR=1 FL=1
MCVLTDRLRIASDVYNVLNLLLVFITAYRIPKRVDRTATRRLSFLERLGRARARSSSTTMHADAMPEGASVRDRALADVVATGGERGERGGGDGGGDEMNEKALSDESVELAPQREYTYEFSPHAIVLHRLTRPYFLLQLLLAFPSYTLVVHAAGVYAPQHAVTSRLRERLLSRVKADPAGAVRFLVRTGLAANFAKIVRGVKLILVRAAGARAPRSARHSPGAAVRRSGGGRLGLPPIAGWAAAPRSRARAPRGAPMLSRAAARMHARRCSC